MDLAGLLAAQDRLMHRRHARAAGVTRSALAHRVRPGGPWQIVLPGVVATFTGRLTVPQQRRAALLFVENGTEHAAGEMAMLSAATACLALGLLEVPAHVADVVYVLADQRLRRRASLAACEVRRTTRLPDPWWRGGLPVTPVARAVVDACRELRSLREVRALVAEAVQTRRTTVARIGAEVMVGASTGSRLVRRALEEVGWGARSAPEAEVVRDINRAGLPPARWNRSLLTLAGEWLADPDAWWKGANTVLEIDSHRYHLSPARAEQTMARHERMTRHGLLVVHVSPSQYREDRVGFRQRLFATLRVGAAMPPAPVVDAAEYRLPAKSLR